MKKPEQILHSQIIQYIKMQYKYALYFSDISAVKMTMGQAVKLNSLRIKGHPDIMIFNPNLKYNGLAIELKAEGVKLYKKDGTFKTEHLINQRIYLHRLREFGWYASFSIGFDTTKRLIDNYFRNELR